MALTGKGWFIWQIARCEGGSPAALAERAAAAGLSHVLIKIAERTFGFGFDKSGRDLLPPVVEALRARGLQVWGWHYIYGDNPAGEADIAVRRVTQLQLDGYVADAEAEYKRPGMSGAARQFMAQLRAGLSNTPVALSSYRYPSLHPQLPWTAFLEKCDLVMPQVYWEQSHNPGQQLARSVDEFSRVNLVGVARPVVPTGAAYGVASPAWRVTPVDIRQFLTKARELNLPAANLYGWDYAGAPANQDLWQALAEFNWPPPAPQDIVARYIAALNSGDVPQLVSLYQTNAGHVTARRTLVGRDDIAQWCTALCQQMLPGAQYELIDSSGSDTSRRFRWAAIGPTASVADGDDVFGLRDGRIQYHFTSFTLTPRN